MEDAAAPPPGEGAAALSAAKLELTRKMRESLAKSAAVARAARKRRIAGLEASRALVVPHALAALSSAVDELCLRRVREFLDQLDGLSWGWNIFVTSLATDISIHL